MKGNVIVGQSGGPTAAINSSLAGVYRTAIDRGAKKVYGMLHGIEGLLKENYIDLSEHIRNDLDVELLKRTPAAYLGSCRYKLPDIHKDMEIYKKIFEILDKLEIEALVYIGGNDSMDTVAALSQYAKEHEEECFLQFIVDADGNVYTWGYNGYGQLGDNSTTTRLYPVQIIDADLNLRDDLTDVGNMYYVDFNNKSYIVEDKKFKVFDNKFNTMYSSINGLKETKIGDGTVTSAATSQVGTYVGNLNEDLEALVNVNKQIASHSGDDSLKTQRDQILADLSSLANVEVTINASGTANVSLGDRDLVLSGEVVGKVQLNTDGTLSVIDKKDNATDITSKVTGGKIGGLMDGLSSVEDALTSINDLANAFAALMNGIQTYVNGDVKAAAYDRANDRLVVSTEDLFTTNDGSGVVNAKNIAINSTVYNTPDLVAAARVDTSVTGWEQSVGNGDNALEFYTSQSTKIPALGHLTISDYLTGLSTRAAMNAASKASAADTQAAIVDNIQNQILAETGVNLDEELSNMIMYKQAYNASARVFSACVEVYDTLLALGT